MTFAKNQLTAAIVGELTRTDEGMTRSISTSISN